MTVNPARTITAAVVPILLAACTAAAPAGDPSPTPSQVVTSPSASPPPAATPTETASPSSPPSEPAAPDEWTQVHTIGDGSSRMVGGEIVWGGAGFLAIGHRYEAGEGGPRRTESTMWLSEDGSEWSEVDFPLVPSEQFLQALSAGVDGSYLVFATEHPTPESSELVLLRSMDGTSWEQIETSLGEDLFIHAITEGPAGYLLVGGQGHDTNPSLWLSEDGLSWEQVHEFSQDSQYVQLHDGDGGDEGYVVIGRTIELDSSSYQRFAFASADGREWMTGEEPFGADDQEFVWEAAVTSFGPDWVATMGHRDETTSIWTSENGLDWAQVGTLEARNLSTTSGGVFEEVDGELLLSPGGGLMWDGTVGVWSSTDGATWSPVELGADAWLGAVARGDGVVAVTGTVPGGAEGFTSTGSIWIRASD